MLVPSNDSKDLLSVMVLLKQSQNGLLPSNEKRAMNTHTNGINSDSSEQKYVHLSSGLIQSFEIRYTFRV